MTPNPRRRAPTHCPNCNGLYQALKHPRMNMKCHACGLWTEAAEKLVESRRKDASMNWQEAGIIPHGETNGIESTLRSKVQTMTRRQIREIR